MSQYTLNNKKPRQGHTGNRKIAQVRTRPSEKEIATALSEGVELCNEWQYTAPITKRHAVRYYNECKGNPLIEAEWTCNMETHPFKF